MTWVDETSLNQNFSLFKKSIKQQITLLGKSTKTVYNFLRNKVKVLPTKQQQKWCDKLKISPCNID